MISAISETFKKPLELDNPLREATSENTAVRLGSMRIDTNSIHDAQQICNSINDLLKEYFKKNKKGN
jgi:hypothetical protein